MGRLNTAFENSAPDSTSGTTVPSLIQPASPDSFLVFSLRLNSSQIFTQSSTGLLACRRRKARSASAFDAHSI
jgi:hypothetical protein